MNKYFSLFKYELKNVLKDKMSFFMLVYPLLMLFITGFLVPEVLSRTETNPMAMSYTSVVLILINITIGAMMGGFLLGFALIENKDERTINSIAVTPASIKGYIAFKSVYATIISFIGNMVILFGLLLIAKDKLLVFDGANLVSAFRDIKAYHIIAISFTTSLLTPALAMVMASFAKNKVEAFVFVKAGGMVLMLPILMTLNFFDGATQYILSFLPHFWCAKAAYNVVSLNTNSANLSFWLYNLIGAVYAISIALIAARSFNRKLQIST